MFRRDAPGVETCLSSGKWEPHDFGGGPGFPAPHPGAWCDAADEEALASGEEEVHAVGEVGGDGAAEPAARNLIERELRRARARNRGRYRRGHVR